MPADSDLRHRRSRWTRLAVWFALLVGAAYLVGFKPVFAFTEVSCPPTYTEQPVGIQGGIYRCIPPGGAAGVDPRSLLVGSRQREIGLYLANLNVRVFDFDIEQGNYHWFARGVPPPP